MKNFLILIFSFLPFTAYTQELSIRINLDSVELIRIIDHQNFNCEWYSGRVYEITKNDLTYEMQLVEQYSKPFFFGEPETSIKEDSLDISKSKLLEKLEVSINQDSAINLANRVVSKKHQFWANRINIENIDESIKIESFNGQQLFKLIDAINDLDSRSPRKILENLGMDSSWISENSLRLFEAYKLPDIEPTQEQKEYCLSCFKDQKKTMTASFSLIGSHNTFDYPFIEIQFINSDDTLNFYTDNPYPLSMPWIAEDSIKYYNPKISLLLAELLPDLAYSNKRRLSGDYSTSFYSKSIEEAFTKSMLNKYCSEFNGKKKRRRKRV
jgi:hypothetical protein